MTEVLDLASLRTKNMSMGKSLTADAQLPMRSLFRTRKTSDQMGVHLRGNMV